MNHHVYEVFLESTEGHKSWLYGSFYRALAKFRAELEPRFVVDPEPRSDRFVMCRAADVEGFTLTVVRRSVL